MTKALLLMDIQTEIVDRFGAREAFLIAWSKPRSGPSRAWQR
jgi:hypothetical protein